MRSSRASTASLPIRQYELLVDADQRRRLRSCGGIIGRASPAKDAVLSILLTSATRTLVAFLSFVASQYEILFRFSISTFHVSVMAITPAIASHKVRHPSPSNFSVFLASRLAAVTSKRGCGDGGCRGHGAKDAMQMSECGSEIGQRFLRLCTTLRMRNLAMYLGPTPPEMLPLHCMGATRRSRRLDP